MQGKTTPTNGHPRELTLEEGWEIFDRLARHDLNMSGADFLEALDNGRFDDPDSNPDVMHLAMLIPLVR